MQEEVWHGSQGNVTVLWLHVQLWNRKIIRDNGWMGGSRDWVGWRNICEQWHLLLRTLRNCEYLTFKGYRPGINFKRWHLGQWILMTYFPPPPKFLQKLQILEFLVLTRLRFSNVCSFRNVSLFWRSILETEFIHPVHSRPEWSRYTDVKRSMPGAVQDAGSEFQELDFYVFCGCEYLSEGLQQALGTEYCVHSGMAPSVPSHSSLHEWLNPQWSACLFLLSTLK